ncbi:hypothetical protein NFI95_13645 [Acetobacteraceae bacterium KSS8]|uniref:Lipoprotein n=1 Tax=Endosaccharibacter trunci TaxID=2812733 RepID=A0ABT1W9B0_9PROT|nr:hypothetical protein [Acetobacteraceae bacterium KSS8]
MSRFVFSALTACALAMLAGCDGGPYDPAQHHAFSDSSTGSLLSGTDTGEHDGTTDPALSANGAGGAPGGR